MPGAPDVLSLLHRAVSQGVNATEALNLYRAAGGEIRTATWYRLYGEIAAVRESIAQELQRPLHRAPTGEEMSTWTTRRRQGIAQQVNVYMREQQSGIIIAKPYTAIVREPRSRQSVIEEALTNYGENQKQYGLQPLGALYVGTYQLEPTDL